MSQENNFIPELESYKKITPFRLFVKTNFPFIEATYEARDNYGLYCKIVEYLNNVIKNENTVESNVSELYNAFVSLNDYVSDYFDNLDVQEEINKKLDEMAESGVLQDIVNNLFNEIETNVNNQLIAVNNKVDALASGSPIPVTSTSEMTDTTKVYLLLSDGNWYYNNGTNWVVGGTYQSTGIGNNSITAEKLEEKLRDSIGIRVPELSFTSGYYRNSVGAKNTNNSYSLSNAIRLKENEIIYFCSNAGASTSVSVITGIYENENPIAPSNYLKVRNIGDVLNVYKFKAPFDMYVDLCIFNTNNYSYCFIDENEARTDIYEKMKGYRIPETDFETNAGHYANGGDLLVNDNYSVSEPIALNSGEIIRFHAMGEGSVISLLRLVQSDGTYISTIKQTSGTGEYDVEYEALSNCYVSICSQMKDLRDL